MIFAEKNSKIASLMSCQSQSRDLEGSQWILWIYADAAHVWMYKWRNDWKLIVLSNFKVSSDLLYVAMQSGLRAQLSGLVIHVIIRQ